MLLFDFYLKTFLNIYLVIVLFKFLNHVLSSIIYKIHNFILFNAYLDFTLVSILQYADNVIIIRIVVFALLPCFKVLYRQAWIKSVV